MEQQMTTPEVNTTAQPENTPSTAVMVDTDGIITQASQKATEAAEKKMEAVFKSMLQQQGLDADSINKMTAEWKGKQQTPEQVHTELSEANAKLQKELDAKNQQFRAIAKGIPADKSAQYIALATTYGGEDFDKALDMAIEAFPLTQPTPPPAYAAGTGSEKLLAPTEKEQILQAAKDAMRIK